MLVLKVRSPFLDISKTFNKVRNSEAQNPEMDVLKNFSKFTRKYLYKGLYFNKVAGLSLQFC